MNQLLLNAAMEVVPDRGLLINMVSLRVRQLDRGAKPLIDYVPGAGLADVALGEIIHRKLTFQLTPGANGKPVPRTIADPFSIEPGGKKR